MSFDQSDTVVQFYRSQLYPTLDSHSTSHTTALATFIAGLLNQCTNHAGCGPTLEEQLNVRRLTAADERSVVGSESTACSETVGQREGFDDVEYIAAHQ